MKITVVSAFVAGSYLAHALNTIKMAQGFARLNHDVTMICFEPENAHNKVNFALSYGLEEPIHWHFIQRRFGPLPIDANWLFSLLAWVYCLRHRPDFVFCRSYIFPFLSSLSRIPSIGESHAHPDNQTREFRLFVRATHLHYFRKWITISEALATHYRSLGVPSQKLLVLPDAVDLALFERPVALPPTPYTGPGPHVTYTGHLYDYKGIPTILAAAAYLPHVQFNLVGGLPEDIARHQATIQAKGLTNVHLHGLQPHSGVPAFLWHADILLLPPSQHHPSAAWTSPLKLGEYLASGTPIIATSIPALLDWLTSDEVVFVPPDDPQSLAEAIQNLINQPQKGQKLGTCAIYKAQSLSYTTRAQTIISSLSHFE